MAHIKAEDIKSDKKKGFIKREDVVRVDPVLKEEFDLPPSQKVANYDGEELARYWNSKNMHFKKPNVFKRLWVAWRNGIWGHTSWVVLIYLLAYYFVNVLVVQYLCARDYASQHTLTNHGTQLMIDAMRNQNNCPPTTNNESPVNKTIPSSCADFDKRNSEFKQQSANLNFKYSICLNYDVNIQSLSVGYNTFTRILTFLIGFYVSFTISQWWTQITSIPTIDSISLALEGFTWCDDNKNEDEILVKEGLSVTQFKQTILRYCILSWTMCFSFLSPPLMEKFRDQKDFIENHLLTPEEYMKLLTSMRCPSVDGWKVKWTIPIIWANEMLSKAQKLHPSKSGQMFSIIELKEILKVLSEFQRSLHRVFHLNNNRVPDLIIQAIKVGLWWWLLVGVVSSQGLINKESNINIIVALILNFPAMHVMQYIVMFGWLHAASYMQNPFGYDE